MRANDLCAGRLILHPTTSDPVEVVRVTRGLKAVKVYFKTKGMHGRITLLPNYEVEEVR